MLEKSKALLTPRQFEATIEANKVFDGFSTEPLLIVARMLESTDQRLKPKKGFDE